ncbi:hypothetical protein BgiBS90_035336, partial [Biomphalaria glabrata]
MWVSLSSDTPPNRMTSILVPISPSDHVASIRVPISQDPPQIMWRQYGCQSPEFPVKSCGVNMDANLLRSPSNPVASIWVPISQDPVKSCGVNMGANLPRS